MNKVQTTIGRWVQRIAGRNKAPTAARRAQRPTELDAQVLRQVGGGDGPTLPTKGW
jgi:hypothetical protein